MTTHSFNHHPERGQFTLDWGGHTAFVNYDIRDGIWHLLHAEVPVALRGQGVGQVLVERTYAHLNAHGAASVPVCSYIQALLKRHPQWLAPTL
jgi:uncharacterized protein